MSSPIEEIKSRIDVVELIQSYVRLHKAGINFKANCPFHTEKSASFFVSPVRQIWHCFGCGKGGDAFKFIMEIEGHDFPEALRLLAQRAGVVLKREDPAIRSERNRLYDLCEEATKVFEHSLALTPAAKAYLAKRGVHDQTAKEFRIGFAPQSWDFLLKALAARGFKREEVEKAGLAIRSEDGVSWYDRFRSRIMFPIGDANGRVIGFGGRIFEQEVGGKKPEASEAKYVNTPATLLYDKSRVLYGFEKAKQEIRKKNQVILVEGYMDCIMSHQAEVKNAIAVSGTALTPQQLQVIRRLCDTIISSFDTDAAGESATRRSLALASQFEFERKIATIPRGKDPADTVCEDPKLWQDAVANAKNVTEFYFEKVFREKRTLTAENKKEVSLLLVPLVAEIANEIEKAHWVGELAQRLTIPEEAVWKEMRRSRGDVAGTYAAQKSEEKSEHVALRRNLLEDRLLALLTVVQEDTRENALRGHYLKFSSPLHEELFSHIQGKNLPEPATPAITAALDMLKFKSELLAQTVRNCEEEFLLCKRELEKECVKENLLKLGEEISKKEKEGNQIAVAALLQNFRSLSEQLKSLFV